MRFVFLLLLPYLAAAQLPIASSVLPENRMTDWTTAGYRFSHFGGTSQHLYIDQFGAVADGQTPTGTALQAALASVSNGDRIVLHFGSGTYFFDTPISLPENIRLEGGSADSTRLLFDLNGAAQHCISADGSLSADTSSLLQAAALHDTSLFVLNPALFAPNDYIYIKYDDSALMFSTWGYKTGGQILRIKAIVGNELQLYSRLRLDLPLAQTPYIQRITPKRNIEIACLKIERLDQTAAQTMNISMNYVVDSRIESIESNRCNYAHIELSSCLNISVRDCYLHHAFDYGDGGKAYGTMLHFTTSECLIENNIFEHLRHSTIVQAGANGNVFGYNYSFDPYAFLTLFYSDFVGDAVCHGNYPFRNLWEGNILSYILVDNSHGANGGYNTFFRNRATKYGIQVSNANSPNQQFLGNEIPSSSGLYNLAGTGHVEYGNNNRGTITPAGTEQLADVSLYRSSPPDFLPAAYFGGIGSPNAMSSYDNAAYEREIFFDNHWTNTLCGSLSNPFLSAANTQFSATEGDTIQVPLYFSFTNAQTPCSLWLSPNAGTATLGSDYAFASDTLHIAANNNSIFYFSIIALDDALVETANETAQLRLSSSCAVSPDSLLQISILDNDLTGTIDTQTPTHTRLSPNPAQELLHIQSAHLMLNARVFSLQGQLLASYSFTAQTQQTIPVSALSLGLYWLEIQYENGAKESFPFLVRPY